MTEIKMPVRVSHRHTQRISGTPDEVMPLLCPVREGEWIPGWSPRLVISNSGLAEPGAVFVNEVEGREAVWLISEHDRKTGRVSMIEVVAGLAVIELEIEVRRDGTNCCLCEVTYTYTALSEEGEAFVAARTETWYAGFMREWERLLNHYLETGTRLEDPGTESS